MRKGIFRQYKQLNFSMYCELYTFPIFQIAWKFGLDSQIFKPQYPLVKIWNR